MPTLLLALLLVVGAESGADSPRATTGREDSRVQVTAEGAMTMLSVTSPFGIDTATIRRQADHWPKSLVVRLHLHGLESFKATVGPVAVEWSVSSHGGAETRLTLHQGEKETPVGKESPYYAEVRIVGGAGKIPLDEGYFEIALPAKLLEGNPQEIVLQWVDFYRN